ncbi:penicillin-binding protein [Fusobacterium animalis]|uniref:penicillin-binding protein n=1 Tax=Fusobacterium animalis TaxID=76859 RepID=UPI0030CFF6E1
MYYIYSKEKLPKLLFDVNLTSEEVKLYGGWDAIFSYYPGVKKDETITVERTAPFIYPILDNNIIREMTREEKVQEGIEVQLEPGEVIRDKKIIKIAKPQKNKKYLTWNKEQEKWEFDSEKEQKEYFDTIDNIKASILEYGFDYDVEGTHHRQRCRDKDIAYMVANIVALQVAEKLGVSKKITWYFEDNKGMEAGLQELGMLMLYGTTFVQSVFDTENYFKVEVSPKDLTRDEFERKRKELHIKLAKM